MNREKALQIALVADGSSDESLIPLLVWALRCIDAGILLQRPRFHPRSPPGGDLAEFVANIVEADAPDILFIHRDAERLSRGERKREIPIGPKIVPVIPVRMTEAWLLIDERAIRTAAGNPNGRAPLKLPHIHRLETVSDPKATLYAALVDASGFGGRRRQLFQRAAAARRVAENIADFTPLRALPAFQEMEADLARVWDGYKRLASLHSEPDPQS